MTSGFVLNEFFDRAARQGYLFRQMMRRDTQLAAQLTSLGKACEVARASFVASLLVAMREQELSSKLLAFEKQLEDHEVAVLELERQVAVLELGENFKRVSDFVDETVALEWERQLAVVELHDKFKQLFDQVVLMDTMDDQFELFRKAVLVQLATEKLKTLEEVEARCGDWGNRLQQLEDWVDEVDGGAG